MCNLNSSNGYCRPETFNFKHTVASVLLSNSASTSNSSRILSNLRLAHFSPDPPALEIRFFISPIEVSSISNTDYLSRSRGWILLSLRPHLPNRQSAELDEARGGPASCPLQTLYTTVTFHWAKKPQPLISSYYYFSKKTYFSIKGSNNLVCWGE